MDVINGEDVNELYFRGVTLLRQEGKREETRNGPALVMPYPVMSVYKDPCQRVLFDTRRAANPFFHLFESLWMLAGRDDVAALNTYITDFGTRFAEADGKVHGAYGHRWRKAFGFDQLDAIVARLKANPQDRQCVLQMWDARIKRCPAGECDAPGTGSNDLLGDWKDRPCNTQVYFRVRNGVLDMTITCRSNDIIFGAYGANAVHFSILQEYMAGRIGVDVGTMYQFSNNYHAYVDVLDRIGQPSYSETYARNDCVAMPLGDDWERWDEDLATFMFWQGRLINEGKAGVMQYFNQWFTRTAEPMFTAHWRWKNAMHHEAVKVASLIEADDWRTACLGWFEIRNKTKARSR